MTHETNSARALRGVLIMIGGLALLLYTLGLMQKGLTLVLVIGAIIAMVYGFYVSGLYDIIKHVSQKRD